MDTPVAGHAAFCQISAERGLKAVAVFAEGCTEEALSGGMRRVLLVEDNDVLRENYRTLLSAHRLSVQASATKEEAELAFDAERFACVILDVTLGDDIEAGFDLCQRFRIRQSTVPIIFLTERDDDVDRISGLRLGADDYLTKTISATYLVARVNALIRRVETLTQGSAPNVSTEAAFVEANPALPMRIDEKLSRAYWNGVALDLSLTQFWILRDLIRNEGSVRSIDELMKAASITVQPNTIVVHIKAIRESIQKLSPGFAAIKSERARGYRWVTDAV